MKDHLESSIFGDHDEQLDVHEHTPSGREPEAPAAVPRTRREVREAEEAARRNARRRSGKKKNTTASDGGEGRGRPSILRRIAVILLALVVVGGGVAVAYTYLWPIVADMLEPNDYPGPGSGEVQVKIEEGAGGSAIARLLASEGVVKSTKAFIEAARDEPKSAGIQPGVYELRKQMRASDALAILIDPKNRITTAVTIPEGLWATEIYAKLSEATGIPVTEYVAAAKDPSALGLPPAAKGNVEGYLFPASYTFDPGTTAKDQLAKMVAESTRRLEALGVPETDMERVMTIASLVEAEARFDADRPKVARVVDNRLAAKMPLQFDSTVNYAQGKHGITTTNEARASASPYNTYKVVGLPPGPIGNPGESAIKAAAQPADGPWLYFVTVNPTTGETKFAATYAEHEKNVAQFQAWCAANKGKC